MQSASSTGLGFTDRHLTHAEVRDLVSRYLASLSLAGKRVLLVVPDATRTAPVGLLFKAIHDAIGSQTAALDAMIALGTHTKMDDDAINKRLDITAEERTGKYGRVRVMNHAYDDPASLTKLGTISARETSELSGGLFSLDVDVTINRAVLNYDRLAIVGPVFPHEVVGFSGGNKYLFPGIGGREILNFFHWLGAVITNPKIIGTKHTPVRRVVDRAAAMVATPRSAFCMVVDRGELAGLYAGTPEEAWSPAADLSDKLHVLDKDRPFHTVLSCAPNMYEDLWVGGKCMYKLEPVVADGGELIIYAPHIRKLSDKHGDALMRFGYHTRDYFRAQWDRFQHEEWGELAHSTHVRGIGTFEHGVEKPRIAVTLATGISEDVCRAINLGYRDPSSINVADYADREDEGILYVPKAGEMLYRLKNPPEWAIG